MSQSITLTAADGVTIDAYRADPTGKPKGGLVVLQEIFGVNAHIRRVADGFAAQGYLVIAPALSTGPSPASNSATRPPTCRSAWPWWARSATIRPCSTSPRP